MESKSREQFEAWMSQHCADIGKFSRGHRNGMYKNPVTHQMWQSWKVSRASLVVDLSDMHLLPCDKKDVTEALRAAGITVKGEGDGETNVFPQE